MSGRRGGLALSAILLAAALASSGAKSPPRRDVIVVLNKSDNTASIVDAKPATVVAPDGRRAWASCTDADVVAVLDLETLKIVGRWKAGREPGGLAGSFADASR